MYIHRVIGICGKHMEFEGLFVSGTYMVVAWQIVLVNSVDLYVQ